MLQFSKSFQTHLVCHDIIRQWDTSEKSNVCLSIAHQELLSFLLRAGHVAGLQKGLVFVCGARRKSEGPTLLPPNCNFFGIRKVIDEEEARATVPLVMWLLKLGFLLWGAHFMDGPGQGSLGSLGPALPLFTLHFSQSSSSSEGCVCHWPGVSPWAQHTRSSQPMDPAIPSLSSVSSLNKRRETFPYWKPYRECRALFSQAY